MQAEANKRLEQVQSQHAQQCAERDQQIVRCKAEAASAAASAQKKLDSELEKRDEEIARVREAADNQIACAHLTPHPWLCTYLLQTPVVLLPTS